MSVQDRCPDCNVVVVVVQTPAGPRRAEPNPVLPVPDVTAGLVAARINRETTPWSLIGNAIELPKHSAVHRLHVCGD